MKGTTTYDTQFIVRKATVDIEDYGFNIDNVSTFNITSTYVFYPIPFVVDDNTASYDIKVEGIGINTREIDCFGIIPLSDGKSGVMDLYHQAFTINNQKYVGIL